MTHSKACVGRAPWPAADPLVGLVGHRKEPDQGVRRGRGRPPHSCSVAHALVRAASPLMGTRVDRSHTRERGVTLIELLIAITLVATLSVGMLMAMRTSLITLEKTDSRLQANRRAMSVQQILARQIGGTMPVIGFCRTGNGGLNGGTPIFNGSEQTLRLVSTYSLAEGARGYPHTLEFQVIPAEGGGVRLIVNEYPYTGPASTGPVCGDATAFPAQAGPDSFVLADRLAYCRFWYHERHPESMVEGRWLPVWNQINLPSAVRVDMAPLVVDPARLPLLGVTVPIHINRDVLGPYVDQQ